MDTDQHKLTAVSVCAVDLSGVNDQKLPVSQMIHCAFYCDAGVSVQREQDLHFFVPVEGMVASWNGMVCNLDSQFADFMEDFVKWVCHCLVSFLQRCGMLCGIFGH